MRIDKYLAEKYGSRTKAERAVLSGEVLVGGRRVSPSYELKESDEITYVSVGSSFVSVGGFKLEKALNDFAFDVNGKIYADIGASTGGFTDCLLQRGAAKVYCVDVGESLLDKSLLDKNVVVVDNFNARNLAPDTFPEKIDGIVADLSFISQTYVLPGFADCLSDGAAAITLIKPQFELEKSAVGKNGIVKDKRMRALAVKRVYDCAVACGLSPIKLTEAPIVKNKNHEYLVLLVKGAVPVEYDKLIKCVNL